MKIVVLNGSPKGATSVTMQYVHYIEKAFPAHTIQLIHISQPIKRLENDRRAFDQVIEQVRSAGLVLWATPVYYLLVPGQYKRFIELVFERGAASAFAGRWAAALTTSIHFFDHTAHNYLRGICDDLGMKFAGGYSAEMSDLMKAPERERYEYFLASVFTAVEQDLPSVPVYPPLSPRAFAYQPGGSPAVLAPSAKKVLILTDNRDPASNLARMVTRLAACFGEAARVVNLFDVKILGGCQGCLQCAYDNQCVYLGKDEYVDFFNQQVLAADILIIAGEVTDRYLSARWKTFFDRSFFRGHTPALMGKQVGFLISGPFGQLPNLRQILEGYIEMQQANLFGFVTDEYGDSAEIDRLLENFASQAARQAQAGYLQPASFLGVGGHKLFRDRIWSDLRFVFQADHRVYQRLDMYDFPQKDLQSQAVNTFVTPLFRFAAIRQLVFKEIKTHMIEPFQKVLAQAH